MVDTEIWLRLMSISSLYGDDMVRAEIAETKLEA